MKNENLIVRTVFGAYIALLALESAALLFVIVGGMWVIWRSL